MNARGSFRLKFLVIGGGISGLFLSYYLLEGGHDVVVADAARGSVRTSAYNAGILSPRSLVHGHIRPLRGRARLCCREAAESRVVQTRPRAEPREAREGHRPALRAEPRALREIPREGEGSSRPDPRGPGAALQPRRRRPCRRFWDTLLGAEGALRAGLQGLRGRVARAGDIPPFGEAAGLPEVEDIRHGGEGIGGRRPAQERRLAHLQRARRWQRSRRRRLRCRRGLVEPGRSAGLSATTPWSFRRGGWCSSTGPMASG